MGQQTVLSTRAETAISIGVFEVRLSRRTNTPLLLDVGYETMKYLIAGGRTHHPQLRVPAR